MRKHFEISYCPLRVSLNALERAELPPYLGSTLRGALGQALLQTDKEACAFLYRNSEKEDMDAGKVVAMQIPVKGGTCSAPTVRSVHFKRCGAPSL